MSISENMGKQDKLLSWAILKLDIIDIWKIGTIPIEVSFI